MAFHTLLLPLAVPLALTPATTTYDFLEGPAPFAVETTGLTVGMPLPNQWTCGVQVTFPGEERSHPIADLLDFLAIEVEMPGAHAVIEVDEDAGTLLVRSSAFAWYDRVRFTSLEPAWTLADAVQARLYPYLASPPAATVELLPCPAEADLPSAP